MQVFSTTISEVITHVHNIIAGQVSRKIIYQLGLEDVIKNHIYINGDYDGPSRSYNEKHLPILHENAFKCNVKYSANPFGIKWDSTTPGQHMDPALHRDDALRTRPVFYDPKHNIKLIERYLPCNIELECSMIFVDKVLAYDVMTRFTSTYVRGELLMVNDLSYDYRMPMEILQRLYIMGTMLGISKGSYLDWLMQCSNGNIQRIVSKRENNRHAEIVIKKQQFNSLASIDYTPDQPAIHSLSTSMDTVTLNFNVTIQFGRVNMLYLKYPIVMNNQLIPDELVTANREDAYGNLYHYLKYPYLALDPAYQFQKQLMKHPARNPWYDDWTVPINSSIAAVKAAPFFIGLFTLDNTNCKCTECECDCCKYKYTKIDLVEDMDQYKLSPDVLKWLSEHPEEALDTESKYSIAVFRDNNQIGASALKFDGRYLSVPNCKGGDYTYHVVISAATMAPDSPWTNNILLVISTDIAYGEKER